jgi:uncharacterized protein YjbI with pentapeptide repeats
MANPEHVKILKQGSEAWNRWREKKPAVLPNLRNCELIKMDLTHANLSHADLSGTNLTEANLTFANLTAANLTAANLTFANLTDADLTDASLTRANLTEANLTRANLINVNFTLTNFFYTDLTEANIENSFIQEAQFSNIDLSKTKGLDKLQSLGHAAIDHRTLMKSKNLPDKFLRDCGLPEQFIEHLPGLLNSLEPIQFHSVFISYSSEDEEFAKRLHVDLQAKGIRCWFAPEDMKIGDKIRTRIDEMIHVYDKLLLVLSKDSVNSSWVEKEVETALENETTRRETVLFPIRLDDTVMDITTGWPADIKRARNIGDFKEWKDHDAYQKSFARLLKDLKQES